jgi:hypothetical protein
MDVGQVDAAQAVLGGAYHHRNIRMATEIMDRLRFTYVFENWYP